MARNTCKACGASFEGAGAAEALVEHVEGFHPAGGPPAPRPEASTKGPSTAAIAELAKRIDALEERVTVLEGPAQPEAPTDTGEATSFAGIKTRAIELGLPVVGVTRADLEASIEAEEERRADAGQP